MENVPSVEEIASWFYGEGEQVKADLEGAEIVSAVYQTGDYCGDWRVEYIKNGETFIVSGAHCSCNGPEWNP